MRLKTLLRNILRFVRAKEAVSALEYAILVGVVVAAVGGALVAFSGNVTTALSNIGSGVASVSPPTMPNLNPGATTGGTTGGTTQ